MTRSKEQIVQEKQRIMEGLSMIGSGDILLSDETDSTDDDNELKTQTIKEHAANSDNKLPFNSSPHLPSDDSGSDGDSDYHLSSDDDDDDAE